jgi:kynurenine formamidase
MFTIVLVDQIKEIKMKPIIAMLLLVVASSSSTASELTEPQETLVLCENSVSLLSHGQVSETFDLLKPYWPLPEAEMDNLSYQTKSQLDMVSKRFGKAIGTDFIRTQKAGNSFLKHTYILKYEKTAIRYICIFYKPKKTWLVNSITWDDKTVLLFE